MSLPRSSSPNSAVEAVFLRLGLAGAGGLLLHLALVIVSSAPLSKSPGDVLILIVSGMSGLCLLVAAGLCRPPGYLRWLILLACIGELGVRSLIWVQDSQAHELVVIDPGLYTDLAGELLRHGENPYAWDVSGAFELYRVSQESSTPGLDAAKVRSFPYPALPFLLVVPFEILGLPGTFLVSLLAHGAVFVLLFLAAPRLFQPLILLPIVAGVDFTQLTLVGVVDIVWGALLVGMAVAWQRPTLRAVLYGLAAAFKQTPWLLLPFLVIRLGREKDDGSPIRSVGCFLAISGTTFLLANLPFIVWDPEAWFHGATEPLRDPLVILSQGGLASLSHLGLAYLPKSYYLIVTLSVLGLLLFCYWRHHNALRYGFWIMPGVIMWFSYRSLASYWIFLPFPMLATLVTQTSSPKESEENPAWGPTLATIAVVLALLGIAGVFLARSPATVEAHPLFPLVTANGRVTRMSVQVTNHGRHVLTPRFAVQHRYTGENPLPWHIDHGPHSLSPGQSTVYHISTQRQDRSFLVHDAAQLVVTDAGGDYSLRDVVTIGPDRSFLWPDAIPNPAYLFWGNVPIFWELATDPPGSGTASAGNKEGRGALMLALNAGDAGLNRVALQTLVPFPLKPFGIWVYSDPPSENASSVAYGLEIDDGQHRLWVLFGSGEYTGLSEEDQYVINRVVPPRTWVYQEIDVLAAYAEAGWPLPELRRTFYRGLDVDLRLVHLGLLLAASGPRESLQAHFGAIEQEDYQVEPRTLMAETFDDPASYYIRLAESYVQGRNYPRALEAYRRALQFSPGAPKALEGIDLVMQHLPGETTK